MTRRACPPARERGGQALHRRGPVGIVTTRCGPGRIGYTTDFPVRRSSATPPHADRRGLGRVMKFLIARELLKELRGNLTSGAAAWWNRSVRSLRRGRRRRGRRAAWDDRSCTFYCDEYTTFRAGGEAAAEGDRCSGPRAGRSPAGAQRGEAVASIGPEAECVRAATSSPAIGLVVTVVQFWWLAKLKKRCYDLTCGASKNTRRHFPQQKAAPRPSRRACAYLVGPLDPADRIADPLTRT